MSNFGTNSQTFTINTYTPSGDVVFTASFTLTDLPDDYLGNFEDTTAHHFSSIMITPLGGGEPVSYVVGNGVVQYDGNANNTPENIYYQDNHNISAMIDFTGTDLFNYFAVGTFDPTITTTDINHLRIDKKNGTGDVTLELKYINGSEVVVGSYRGISSDTVPTGWTLNQVLSPSLFGVAACFNKGTLLKCPSGSIAVEDLKEGDLLSTYLHGDRKIIRILRGVAFNKNSAKTQDTMCVYQDLYITGGHSLMVDELSAEEAEKQDALGFSQKVDDKHLLLTMVSPLFEAAPPGTYPHYHFLLDNDGDKTARYGVWANGVLCETPSEEYLDRL